jgi:hypothetical protein
MTMPNEPRAARPFLSAEASAALIEGHLRRRREAIAEGREPPNLPPQDDYDNYDHTFTPIDGERE